MKKMSIVYKKVYAYCDICKEYFLDDVNIYGSLLCPNRCGGVVTRGLKKENNQYIYI